jgi:hypothetical protein
MIPIRCEHKGIKIPNPGNLGKNKRSQTRSIFICPVVFELFSIRKEPSFYNGFGYLRDIALSGAGLQFEDKYGRFIIDEREDGEILYKDKYGRFEFSEEEKVNINLSLNFSQGEKAALFANVCWIKKLENSFQVRMGVEFVDLEPGQSATLKKLVGYKNKDLYTLWTLWEQYQNHDLMWNLWE